VRSVLALGEGVHATGYHNRNNETLRFKPQVIQLGLELLTAAVGSFIALVEWYSWYDFVYELNGSIDTSLGG
jgi:hypothetical protein